MKTAFLLLIATVAFGQSTQLGEKCDLSTAGGSDAKTFLQFHQELRKAIADQDVGAIVLLVENPLRVNDRDGSVYLKDARSLQLRFQEIFPPVVRKAILDSRPETLFCNYRGIMYGAGVIWVELTSHGYQIQAVNIPSAGTASQNGSRVEFVCRTDKHRILLDSASSGSTRYRSWNVPRSIADKPDLEIAAGKQRMEGTGACAHTIWSFENSSAKYEVEELGCYENPGPPAGATGELLITVSGKTETGTAWCY